MRLLNFCLALVLSASLNAQSNFMAPGATWHYLIPSGGGGMIPYIETNHVIKYTGDSLYNGRMTKILSNAPYYHSSCTTWYNSMLIYTSHDSIFFHGSKTVNDWELLYNYNALAGQSWQLYLNSYNGIDTVTILVDSVKYNTINSISLKTMYVHYTDITHPNAGQSSSLTYRSIIYDRIGDNTCLFNYIFSPQVEPCYNTYLLCYSDTTLGTYQVNDTVACDYSYATGIEQINTINEQVSVYPNPVHNSLQVRIANSSPVNIQITDVLGTEIENEELKMQNSTIQMDVSRLKPGIYFISGNTTNGVYTTKFIKD